MGMTTHVVGFRPADEMWNKMKEIWLACEAADVQVPKEVDAFFDYVTPGDKPGAEVDIRYATSDWNEECAQGFEVDITKLPPDVKILRFYNSW